jgi:uncharacterized membrane protein
MNSKTTFYYVSLSLFALAVVGAVVNSAINYDTVVKTFETLGYPAYLIPILGGAQIIGLLLIVWNKDQWFNEWVYAGFTLNFLLGCIAHLATEKGNGASAVVCLILLWVTYIQSKRVRQVSKREAQAKMAAAV